MRQLQKFTISLLGIYLFLSIPHAIYSQEIRESDRQKITEYKNQIETAQRNNNRAKELEYSNKLAFVYWQNEMNQEAIQYFERCMEINQEKGNKNGIKLISYYLGMIHSEINQYSKSIEYFKKGIQISKEMDLKSSEVQGLLNLAQTYNNMQDYGSSNQYANEALVKAKELNNLKFIRSCYGLLSENHKNMGNSEKSIKYFDLFSSIDKHIKNQEITEIKKETQNELTEAKSKQEKTEKELKNEIDRRKMTEDSLERAEQISRERQMQLEMKELDLKKKQAQLKLEKTLRNSLIFGIILTGIFTLLLLFFYRQKKKANALLSEQNEKINKQNIQIQEQRDRLEIQNSKLNDSINYAENIQTAILPETSELKSYFDPFILYQPKDVVSGDFYWFTQIEDNHQEKIFLAAVDCTGHGVPGAFMSMIGNRLFNEIIAEKKIYEPSEILELLNENIVKALKQEQTDNMDGMDVCLITMNKSDKPSKKVKFAGAKRPLYYFEQEEKTLHQVKGDRYSIGGINKNKHHKEFTTREIVLKQGDILYLTTDGLIDQVNKNGKRFTSKRFLDVLNHYAEHSMQVQKKELMNRLNQFKQGTEQRDDITVIGAKIL